MVIANAKPMSGLTFEISQSLFPSFAVTKQAEWGEMVRPLRIEFAGDL
jgi:hypothetical protein